jgi:hypothetical protein
VKAQCERCKEIVPLEFSVGIGGIEVSCPSCKETYFVRGTGTQPAASPAEVTCPKCGAGQKASDACRRCGLVFANWDPAKAAGPEVSDATEAAALWDRCLEDWDDGARHEAFIEHCRRSGVLALAAARYRQHEGRAGAADRLKQIRTLAEQSLVVAPRTDMTKRKTPLWVGVVIVVLVFLAGYGFVQYYLAIP